jgi:hypothetical protein
MRLANVLAVLAAAMLAGCEQKVFRAETSLAAGGTVRRAIYQQLEETPAEARHDGVWEKQTFAGERPAARWSEPISALPVVAAQNPLKYFAAWGSFASVDKIPNHYRRKLGEGLPECTLERQVERTDYGLVVEHVWRETLTDTISMDEQPAARRELVGLLIDVGEATLAEHLGPDYDTSGLRQWAETDGTAWFVELTDVVYEFGQRKALRDVKALQQRLVKVCTRYGLHLGDDDFNKAWNKAAPPFFKALFVKHLRRKDGQPVDEKLIEELVAANTGPAAAKLEAAQKKVIAERFGGQEKLEARLKALLARVLGTNLEILGSPRRFYFTAELPGLVVESNGTLISESTAEWSFEAFDAFPAGYEMRCRSLAADVRTQEKLLGKARINSRADLTALVALCKADEPALRNALVECRKQQSLEPLIDYRNAALSSSSSAPSPKSAVRERLKQLDKLLGIDANAKR